MIYLEHTPAAPLSKSVHALWYAQVPQLLCQRERILPSGCVQVILNLARDFLLDCPEIQTARIVKPALVVGARSVYEIVDTSDMADLIGIVFHAGGFAPFVSDSVDLFSNRSVALEDIWGRGARSLRDRLRESATPEARLRCLEEFLREKFACHLSRHPIVDFALLSFERAPGLATVREVARSTGWSERRFSQSN